MNKNIISFMFDLLKSALSENFDTKNFQKEYTAEELSYLFELSKKHDVENIVCFALSKLGLLKDGELLQNFKKQQLAALYRYGKQNGELLKICKIFENEKIAFIPLKGAKIRSFYPQPFMRTSCDIDILVHEEEIDRAVQSLKNAGWEVRGKKNFHDISLFMQNEVHLELHFNIKESKENIDSLLDKVWEYSFPLNESSFEYRQTNEFLVFHILAHISYHFLRGGCGIKPFLDLYILKNKMGFDKEIVMQHCQECNIERFAQNAFLLEEVWFEGKDHTENTAKMEEYILAGGVYGTTEQRVTVNNINAGGKLKNIINRIFMPYEMLILRYKKLENRKYLTPVYWAVRWVETVFKGRLAHSVSEVRANKNITSEKTNKVEELLKDIGLK